MKCFSKLIALFIPIVLLFIVATPAMAIAYYASIMVQETSGTDYGNIGLIQPMDISFMANQGFINSDGRDVQIMLGDTSTPRMLVEDKLLFVDDVTPHQSDSFSFSTNNTPEDFSIISGYSGNITISDSISLEPANNCRFDFVVPVTSDNYNIINKINVFDIINDGLGGITAKVYGYGDAVNYPYVASNSTGTGTANNFTATLPSGTIAGDLLIIQIDSFLAGGAVTYTAPTGWSTALWSQVYCAARSRFAGYWKQATGTDNTTFLLSNSAEYTYTIIRIPLGYWSGTPSAGISVFDDSTLTMPDPPALTSGFSTNMTTYFAMCADPGGNVTAAPASYGSLIVKKGTNSCNAIAYRQLSSASDNPGAFTLAATNYWAAETIAVKGSSYTSFSIAGLTIGTEVVGSFIQDGVHAWITANGATSSNYTAVSILDNSTNWLLEAPYYNYYKESVNGTQQLWFQPNALIVGTNLPDREPTGGSNNGTISFGTNPVSINIQTGYLQFDESVETGQDIITPDSVDTLNQPDNMSHQDSDMNMTFNLFYFMVSWLSGVTGIDVVMIWWWFSATLSIGTLVLVRRFLNSIWVAGMLSAIVSGAFVAMGMTVGTAGALEFWNPVVIIIATAFTGVWNKTSEAG